jgi:hypothetical protein
VIVIIQYICLVQYDPVFLVGNFSYTWTSCGITVKTMRYSQCLLSKNQQLTKEGTNNKPVILYNSKGTPSYKEQCRFIFYSRPRDNFPVKIKIINHNLFLCYKLIFRWITPKRQLIYINKIIDTMINPHNILSQISRGGSSYIC